MAKRRYRVSLVGYESPDPPATHPAHIATRGFTRAWMRYWRLSWQLRLAIVVVFIAIVLMAIRFI